MRIGCSLVSGYICRNHHRVLPHHICGPILRSLLGRIRPSWKHQQMFPDYTTCRSVLVHSKKYKTHPSNLGEGDNIGYYKWWDSSFCPWGWWWWWWRNISHWTRGRLETRRECELRVAVNAKMRFHRSLQSSLHETSMWICQLCATYKYYFILYIIQYNIYK